MSAVDWHYWRDDPPKPLEPIMACWSLEKGDWLKGHGCRRGCCFVAEGMGCMVLPNFWKPLEGDNG